MGGVRVLLVEDNVADARLLAELLKEIPGRPFELTTVGALAASLPLLPDHDVVLLDLSLPDAHGLTTVERLVGAGRARPIVVLTGNDDQQVAVDALKAGAQDYLLKTEMTPSLVARTLRYAIERKRVEAVELERAKAERAAGQARFLARVAAQVSGTLDLQTALQDLALLLVPTLGDVAIVQLVGSETGTGYIAGAQSSGTGSEPLPTVNLDGAVLARQILSTGKTMREHQATFNPVERPFAHRFGASSMLVTPLIARGQVIGAITYASRTDDRRHTEEDQFLAEEIAAHVALTVENARLFRRSQEAIQARDGLLAVVSHDLRGPLDVVSLALSLLETTADEKQLGLLARGRRGIDRMKRLIEDLLDVARMDAGTLKVAPESVKIVDVIDEVYELHRPLANEKRIELLRELDSSIGALPIDRHRVVQALSNLLANAIKFTPSGGSVRLSANRAEEAVVFVVQDSGPGIPNADLSRVFDRFWQRENVGTKGVGLGLAIVKGIAEAHGGSVAVRSVEGAGAEFTIRLPTGAQASALALTTC